MAPIVVSFKCELMENWAGTPEPGRTHELAQSQSTASMSYRRPPPRLRNAAFPTSGLAGRSGVEFRCDAVNQIVDVRAS